ncbi:MAG: Mrp/NBP35 family ATP-binding protein [Trichlorobacter sp.]
MPDGTTCSCNTQQTTDQETVSGCSGAACSSCHDAAPAPLSSEVKKPLNKIGETIVVMSGKGGVGKSTIAVNIAISLQMAGFRVGILDSDIHGPSIPTMLGVPSGSIMENDGCFLPIAAHGLKVISIGYFLENTDDAVIWRGPVKAGVITQFINDVVWGELDYLVVDSPPGTGDEPLTVCQSIDGKVSAVIVTTPQKVADVDVRKSISFCRDLPVPILGIIENMSGFVCPHCGEVTELFGVGGGKALAEEFSLPFLGAVPIDPAIVVSGDTGQPFVDRYRESVSAQVLNKILSSLIPT